jgi:antitoxin MazE
VLSVFSEATTYSAGKWDREVVDKSLPVGYTRFNPKAKGGFLMVTKIQKWGSSQGLRINSQLLEEARISIGDEVDIAVHEGFIVVAPVRKIRGKCSLKELISRIPENYQAEEVNWGKPMGKEVW